MQTIFFASNIFEIFQSQNIVAQLRLPKEDTYLVLWLYQPNLVETYIQQTETNLFADIIFITRPAWKNALFQGKKNLLRTKKELEELFNKLDVSEIFVPDPEKDFQILEPICQKRKIKLSLYETGLETYRYLSSHDPNKSNLIYRISMIKKFITAFFQIPWISKSHNNDKHMKIIYLLLYNTIPELGQLLFPKDVRGIMFRIHKFHRCLCSNPQIINSIFDVESTELLSFNNLVSNKQQMIIYSSPEFWDITPNHLLFIDQDYLSLGVTIEQHVSIVIKCLETFGRISDIVIKPNWKISSQIAKQYQNIIAQKKYKIQILNSEVIAEVIVATKKIRKIASLAGSSFIYSKLSNQDIRAHCFHRTYEEKAKEIGIDNSILIKIKRFHDLFDKINPLKNELNVQTNHQKLNNSFLNFTDTI